jgi:hypothetical protein
MTSFTAFTKVRDNDLEIALLTADPLTNFCRPLIDTGSDIGGKRTASQERLREGLILISGP